MILRIDWFSTNACPGTLLAKCQEGPTRDFDPREGCFWELRSGHQYPLFLRVWWFWAMQLQKTVRTSQDTLGSALYLPSCWHFDVRNLQCIMYIYIHIHMIIWVIWIQLKPFHGSSLNIHSIGSLWLGQLLFRTRKWSDFCWDDSTVNMWYLGKRL